MTATGTRAPELAPPAHRLYRALIDGLLATGGFPAAPELAATLGVPEARVGALLDELVAGEWAGRDAAGSLAALYPFSAAPTGVLVRVGGAERHAMCAIDALGIAPMLGATVAISAACRACDAPLRLTATPGGVESRAPAGIAVIYRRTPGPAHLARCRATRFVCSPEHGQAWLAARGHPDDVAQPLPVAFARARAIFSDWYAHGRSGGAGSAGGGGERGKDGRRWHREADGAGAGDIERAG